MVPSWSETLIKAQNLDFSNGARFEVIGRTRFCIHPKDQVKSLPVVGGTKDIQWERLKSLNPDLLILDKDENPRWMFDQAPCECLVTHVQDWTSMVQGLESLGQRLKSPSLLAMKERGQALIDKPLETKIEKVFSLLKSQSLGQPNMNAKVNYIIWKDPWMVASDSTFIGDMLRRCGLANRFKDVEAKYPEVQLDELREGLNLFSSEPFPFHLKQEILQQMGLEGLLIDGEPLTWFGIRALEFLEALR